MTKAKTKVNIRHRARIAAMQALFELDVTEHQVSAVLSRQSEETPGQHAAETEAFLQHLVNGAWARRDDIDAIIVQAAPTWPLHQMPGVDKAVLRIAIFELMFSDAEKAPIKAVINEAVELAKHFGSDNSSRFVNGVLGTVVATYLEPPATH